MKNKTAHYPSQKKIRSQNSVTDGYVVMFLMGFARSPFRDSESRLRFVVGLDEDDIQLILKQYNSFLITYEILSGIYKIKNNSKVVYTMGDQEATLQVEKYINLKTYFDSFWINIWNVKV